ncbi:hypothetical protein GH714_004632 [Hevea brasiliensis]|uniref:FAD-binding FR-type domain-containing protein n=1 Tax=Hevea brasiliensis TaxID=3981 RepID=A0A6A6KGW3_HEVBR|nr:hypothetical protein GH714_004632 [Hevea brasiliensis]
MGCTISLALAAKYSNCVKSIVLTAPPYIPSSKEGASLTALEKLAGKRLWPPLIFGSSFMSWYEHLGRCVCLLVCRNHRIWEKILKLLTWRRDLHFMIMDLTRHTHHSAWHTMHNVICGGAKFLDENLDRLMKSGVKFCVIHGDCDNVVPLECSESIKSCLDPENFRDFKLVKLTKLSHNVSKFTFALPTPTSVLGLPIGQHISCRGKDSQGEEGRFRYQPGQVRAFGMLAGGSGITPMFQVARAILENPKDKTKVHLIYANVTYEDILLKILRCGPPPMNKAMAAHLEALGYTPQMQFQF